MIDSFDPMFSVKGKIVLISGAGNGLGRAIAIGLAARGAKVGALDFASDQVQEVCDEIISQGGLATPLIADVRDPAALASCLAQLIEKFGVPEIVTNPFIKLQEIPLYTVFAKTDVPSIITEGTVVPDPGIFKTLNMIGVMGIFEHKT